ncbi:TIGR03086 family metal-binding protein [Nocardia sp. BMG111209]|uniref:TIGR03086 family metal-binding protein n=1 Tax=Nocardia sp. BMG111209 TaxID=1160137 RepID=UPI000380A839|nr:TIGR03086 family metal-binding protein [Nocardia sp. BMG111209]
MADIRALNRRAVDYSVVLVSRITAGDLGRSTPCAAWNLADLLSHMTVQHRGFAAAARGAGADPELWVPRPLAADPVTDYAAAAAGVTAAYTEPGVLERDFDLPEIGPGVRIPGSIAVGFHLIDYVVHGWDVARTLGLEYRLDDALAEPALRIAEAVPNGDERLRPGAAFAPALPDNDATPLDRILTLLGRSPAWPH